MEIITLEESQMIFENVDLLKKILLEKYKFNVEEVEILLSCSLDKIKDMMLIDIIYNGYVKLGCIENKNDTEIKLYNKLLDILNYHVININFRDKKSNFIREFEYAMLHYDEPDLGKGNKRK